MIDLRFTIYAIGIPITQQLETINIRGELLTLHPFRAAYWQGGEALLLADLHLGKARHFRRAGFPVPLAVADADHDRLISLLIDFRPRRVLFLGDLFHSDYNQEWEELEALIRQFGAVHFGLVPGNHDILSDKLYQKSGLELHPERLEEGPFLFSHRPLEEVPPGRYNLAGHVHPCVDLRGAGRQSTRLPCFHFGPNQGILPAFGAFTGAARISPREGDRVFVIAGEEVIEV